MKYSFHTVVFCILILASCSPRYTYFTENLYEKQKWSQEDVKRIQFYVSEDIVLTRAISDAETSITEGRLESSMEKKYSR